MKDLKNILYQKIRNFIKNTFFTKLKKLNLSYLLFISISKFNKEIFVKTYNIK